MKTKINLRVCQVPLVYPHFGLDEEAGHQSLLCIAGRREGKSQGNSFGMSLDTTQWLKEDSIYRIRGDVDSHNPVQVFFAPTIRQAKNIVWKYMKHDMGNFPGVRFNNSSLTVNVPRPLTSDEVEVMLLSTRNADRARGIKIRRARVDEGQDCPDYALKYAISPALKDTAGTLIQTGTVDLGGVFTQRAKHAILNKLPFRLFPSDRTGTFTKDELEAIRKEVGDDAFAREYLCSFNAPLEGVIYYKRLLQMEAEKEFYSAHKIDGITQLLACDLGVGPGTCAWLMQVPSNDRIHLLDYFEDYETVNELREDLEEQGYNPDLIALPHDGNKKQSGAYSVTTMKQNFQDVFDRARVVAVERPTSLRKAIENVSQHLHLLRMPPKQAASEAPIGWQKLKRYRRKVDKNTGIYLDQIDKSQGDDHSADALRTGISYLKCRRGEIGRMPTYVIQDNRGKIEAFPYRGNALLQNKGHLNTNNNRIDAFIGQVIANSR